MASNRSRRIAKELADIHADSSSQIAADPVGDDEDITHLRGSFPGPPGTPYEGGNYYIDIKIPTEYPFKPPVMKFETKIWHPNVSSQTVSHWNGAPSWGEGQVLTMLDRAQFAWIRFRLHGLRFSRSNRLFCRYSRCSTHQNPRIRKTQKSPRCSSVTRRSLNEWLKNGLVCMLEHPGNTQQRAVVAPRKSHFGNKTGRPRMNPQKIWTSRLQPPAVYFFFFFFFLLY